MENEKRGQTGELRDYLKGNLSEEEQSRLEERIFSDDRLFEDLIAEEDDWIDSYVAQRMTPQERNRFEALILQNPELKKKVELAANLRRYLLEVSRKREHGRRVWLAAAVFAFLALAGWWWLQTRAGLSGTTQKASLPSIDQKLDKVIARGDEKRTPKAPVPEQSAVQVMVLSAAGFREPEREQVLRLTDDSKPVEFHLIPEVAGPRYYRVRIETAEGKAILENQPLELKVEKGRQTLIFRMDAKQLPAESLIVILEGKQESGGWETAGEYSFRVAKP